MRRTLPHLPIGLVALATLALARWLAPEVVNGDGLGYLNAQAGSGLYPGHLAYLPLLRLLGALGQIGPRPVALLETARWVSAASGAAAVFALGAAANLLGSDHVDSPILRLDRGEVGVCAAAGLAASFATLAAASDVETYAPALAALSIALWAIAARRAGAGWPALLAGVLFCALAALFHVENLLFLPAAALAMPRRDRLPLLCGASALVAVAYAAAAIAEGGTAWLAGASHGFAYPLKPLLPAVAIYGACKALVYAPYPYQASWLAVIGHFALGAAALAGLLALRPRFDVLGRAAAIAWLSPYALVGAAFFASDQERWIFLLPLLWLAVAMQPRRRAALAIAALIAAANLTAWLPHARDRSARERAHAVSAVTRAGDLVVSPGHGWDEYVGFYDGPPVEHYPLAYHTGRLGSRAALARDLAGVIANARGRVLLVRFSEDTDPMGWKELAPFGITAANARTLLGSGQTMALAPDVERFHPTRKLASPLAPGL